MVAQMDEPYSYRATFHQALTVPATKGVELIPIDEALRLSLAKQTEDLER